MRWTCWRGTPARSSSCAAASQRVTQHLLWVGLGGTHPALTIGEEQLTGRGHHRGAQVGHQRLGDGLETLALVVLAARRTAVLQPLLAQLRERHRGVGGEFLESGALPGGLTLQLVAVCACFGLRLRVSTHETSVAGFFPFFLRRGRGQ